MDSNKIYNLIFGLIGVVLLVIAFNAYQISKLKINKNEVSGNSAAINEPATNLPAANLMAPVAGLDVIPKGVPNIYGKEIGVSFDDVSASNQQKADATIRKLGLLDTQISLKGEELQRYIAVASQISCEYCCGTDSIISPDGKPACGCQHSFAMRGLAKYIIKNHGKEYTNDEILEELGKWKTLFFPGEITKKARILQQKGIELNYINLASNNYRNIKN